MGIEIRQYTDNKVGKDYIVGDIHGEFKKLKTILKKIGFNFSTDRLFSVGDLCDRGPNSEDIIEWTKYDWFIPVMGNHEVMILSYFYGGLTEEYMRNLKADWFINLDKKNKEIVVHYFNSLPVAIEINKENKKIGIVHAMCPTDSWDKFKKLLYGNTPQKMEMANEAMWSFLKEKKVKYVHDMDAIFVGHNIVSKFSIIENTYMLDTGSGYKTGQLTIFNMDTMELVLSN